MSQARIHEIKNDDFIDRYRENFTKSGLALFQNLTNRLSNHGRFSGEGRSLVIKKENYG